MLLALVLAITSPVEKTITVDRLEINTFVDCCGNICWTQNIYWDWHESDGCYHVRDWRTIQRPPTIDSTGVLYREILGNLAIQIREKPIHTITRHDPEKDDRELLPEGMRKKIFPR